MSLSIPGRESDLIKHSGQRGPGVTHLSPLGWYACGQVQGEERQVVTAAGLPFVTGIQDRQVGSQVSSASQLAYLEQDGVAPAPHPHWGKRGSVRMLGMCETAQ